MLRERLQRSNLAIKLTCLLEMLAFKMQKLPQKAIYRKENGHRSIALNVDKTMKYNSNIS